MIRHDNYLNLKLILVLINVIRGLLVSDTSSHRRWMISQEVPLFEVAYHSIKARNKCYLIIISNNIMKLNNTYGYKRYGKIPFFKLNINWKQNQKFIQEFLHLKIYKTWNSFNRHFILRTCFFLITWVVNI